MTRPDRVWTWRFLRGELRLQEWEVVRWTPKAWVYLDPGDSQLSAIQTSQDRVFDSADAAEAAAWRFRCGVYERTLEYVREELGALDEPLGRARAMAKIHWPDSDSVPITLVGLDE